PLLLVHCEKRMIKWRCLFAAAVRVAIRPRLDPRAKVATARSISLTSPKASDFKSTRNNGATLWIAANCGSDERFCGSCRTATCEMLGAIFLEHPQHFRAHAIFGNAKAGNVAAGVCQAFDEHGADWIGDRHEYDRHGARCLLQCQDAGVGIG